MRQQSQQPQSDLSVNDSSIRTAPKANKSRELAATNKKVYLPVCFLTISNHLDIQIQHSSHQLYKRSYSERVLVGMKLGLAPYGNTKRLKALDN
jgi:hypothetical protein